MGKMSNKHLLHRTEEFHRPDSRPFLKDPKWPRDDVHASLRNFRERQASPEVSRLIHLVLCLMPIMSVLLYDR